MKRVILVVFFLSVSILSGCSDSNEIQLLKEQNALLEQQIQQNRLEKQSKKVENQNNSNNTEQYQATTNKSFNAGTASKNTEITTKPIYKEYQKQEDQKSVNTYSNSRDSFSDYKETSPTSCCKVCSKGKACGDSCISRSYQCHKGPGCACDG